MTTQEKYLKLLNLAYEVAQSLQGKKSVNPYLPDCQQLAAKLFFHAATIYQLRQGTKIPVPYSEGGSYFYDFASVIVLARATLETYLTLFEVFFEPTTDDEFEFNHALWQLSGFIIREKFPDTAPTLQVRIKIQVEIQEMRDRLQKTKKFGSLKPKEQKQVLNGIRRGNLESRAKGAGFGEQTIRQIYGYQSGFVHADGLSGTQIVSLKTAKDQVEFIESHMHIVMIVLSKMIIQYAEKFSEARVVCDRNLDAFHTAKVWAGVGSILP